jgi:hypothetical protein
MTVLYDDISAEGYTVLVRVTIVTNMDVKEVHTRTVRYELLYSTVQGTDHVLKEYSEELV